MKPTRLLLTGLLSLPLAACGAGTVVPATRQPPPPAGPPASAFMKTGPLMGLDAKHLTQMLGTPRLDIRESTMRKLQFANGRCVLDAYLYPPKSGRGEPVVTYAETRQRDGSPIDQSSCAAALRIRR